MSGTFFASFLLNGRGVLILIIAAVALYCFGKLCGLKRSDYIMIAVSFLIALGTVCAYTYFIAEPVRSYGGLSGSFAGEVTDMTHYESDKTSYVLKGRVYSQDKGERAARVSLYTNDLNVSLGDKVKIGSCDFEIPGSDYLFDADSYYKPQHIFLTLERPKEITTVSAHRRLIRNAVSEYRERMINDFRTQLGDDCGGFLSGMVFGEKRELGSEVKTTLYRCGIGHLLAVSGLHVSIIIGLFMLLLSRLGVNRFVSFGLVNVLLIFLIIMANSPVSAIRAGIMLDILYSSRLLRRQNDTLNSLAIASLIINISDPYAVYSSGFMLSLSGTFGIGVFAPYMLKGFQRRTLLQKLGYDFLTAALTSISVFPLSMYYFEETSVIAPVMNVFAVPVCSAAMVMGLLYVLTGGLLNFLPPAGVLLKTVLAVSDKAASLPGAYIHRESGLVCAMVLTAGGAVLLLCIVMKSRRAVAIAVSSAAVVIALTSAVTFFSRWNTMVTAVLGRNGNAAVVLSWHGRTDIIDLTGNSSTPRYVRKYLQSLGAVSADSVILTKNIQSQYSAYSHDLSLFPVYSWIVHGDTPVYGGDVGVLFGDELLSYDTGNCHIEYDKGILSVSTVDGELLLTVFPAATDAERPESGAAVCYGSLPKNKEPIQGTVYLSNDLNNFELISVDSDKFYIRRL